MAGDAVAQIRRFNRVVTERIGALNERYLGRDRPLGQARLLWEIGPEGSTLGELRARLDLDSGYLSRLVSSLQADGLIEVVEDTRDRRARVATLTSAGGRELATLDARSDELARSLLEPLNAVSRQRLVAAMGVIERLLTAGSVQLVVVDPEHIDAKRCLEHYTAELNRRSQRPFDPTLGATVKAHELRPPAGHFFIAYLHGQPIGCGAVKHPTGCPAEIKRMWIAPAARGLGLGRRLLHTLETTAHDSGARLARIETNSDLTEAIALYTSTGWSEIDAFNDEPYANRWLQKTLSP
jgi:DNA-binding MarR family transcriptional regulator/GNAT superfamily N-acetyltransferase